MPRLTNQHVLITGANGGLGAPVTRAFLAEGALVTGVARSMASSDFDHTNFHAIAMDIRSFADGRSLVARAAAENGPVDSLVHLVGGFAGGATVESSAEDLFDRMMEINYRAALYVIRAVLPAMRERRRGAILVVGARAAAEPVATLSAYSASKAALLSMVRAVALENKESGIRSNIVLPGTMDTSANRQAMPNADPSRWVNTQQVAQMLVHLASDEASQITGAAIPIYGADL